MKLLKSLFIIKESKKKINFEKSINHFSFPENYKNSDANMFLDEHFNATVDEISTLEYQKVLLSNSIIFKGCRFSVQSTVHLLNGNTLGLINYVKSLIKSILKRKIHIQEAYLATQEWGDNFYHFTLELLPNLINFHSCNPNVPILVPRSYKSKKFIVDYFSIIGIQPMYFNGENVAYIKKLHVCPLPRVGVFNKLNLLNLKDKIEVNALKIEYKPPFRKIYISRSNANKRKISNEQAVIDYLKTVGFEIILAENIYLPDLISILSETSVLISNHGAGLANIIHLQPGQTIIELKSHNDNYWMYFSLSKILEHRYFYLFNKSDSLNYRDANIEVNLVELESILNNYII
jgi:hypothetical protein